MRLDGIFRQDEGLTLVEMLIALALIGIVMAAAFQIFWINQNVWQRTQGMEQLTSQSSLLVNQLAAEVRAAQKPNDAVPAVMVLPAGSEDGYAFDAGQRLIIYLPDQASTRMKRIEYRLVKNDGDSAWGRIEKGWLLSPEAAYPYFAGGTSSGTSMNWATVLENVAVGQLFADETPSEESERRILKLSLKVTDQAHRVPLTLEGVYSSRSQRNIPNE